jgi:hypothetical protein
MLHQLKQSSTRPTFFFFLCLYFLLEMHDAELRIEHWKHMYNMSLQLF